MVVRLEREDLDLLAPFGLLCDVDLVIVHAGRSLTRLTPDLAGRPLLDVFDVVEPAGVTGIEDLRALPGATALLRLAPVDLVLRVHVIETKAPSGLLLVGTPQLANAEQLERQGLSPDDFSPIDHTPDLLRLRGGQEQTLADLRAVNAELGATAAELRSTNEQLVRAESEYRRLVELQPLVMYVDKLGTTPTAQFMSPRVQTWLGYPLARWHQEPGFFFSIVHPEDRPRVWEAHLRAEQTDTPFDEEFRLEASDGRIVWTRAVDSVVKEDGDPYGHRIGFMLDTTTAKTAQLGLNETMSRLTTLLTHMQSGVLVEDAQRRVVMANDTLCGLFRSSARPDDLVGLPASAAVAQLHSPGDDAAAFLRRTEELLHRRWPAVGELMTLADSRVLEFDFQPIVDDGRDLGALWMFRDVTHRVQYEEALARARDEAIATSDAKSQFLASMSHEIRTPMHGVLATIDLLRTTSLDAEQRELIDVVNGSATALVEIINDILDLQKVESGRIELAYEPFDLRGVARAVGDLLGTQARAKGLDLTVYIDPAVPAQVLGDSMRMRQILLNLAGNAVKFTARGSVAIEVRRADAGRVTGLVDIEVRDTGRGIPQDKLESIFDPFVQARRGQDGTGLGLAIADRLVGLMGGELHVTSTVGEGTTFRFQVRLPEQTGDVVERSSEPAAAADRIVLVVDDSTASQSLLMRQLARLGVPARAVSSGGEALEALGHGAPYGLVLVDAEMPDMDGPATTTAIRSLEHPRISRLPVVGLVAGDDAAMAARCREAGMEGCLAKPVDLSDLRRVIDRWFEGSSE